MSKYAGLTDAYLEALELEMDYVRDYCGKRYLDSIYIGGGTPTSLSEAQLDRLLSGVASRFALDGAREYTVEAGRPDTLTREKLDIMKDHKVSRISINPQTMNDETLIRIGRGHTSGDFVKAFYMARERGFDNINADIIIGLEGEGPSDAAHTLARLAELSPDAVTVHTLSVKRASALKEELERTTLTGAAETEEMLRIAAEGCARMGMRPYYMYRQKNMLGNFENVGYCVPGREGIYNVEIMEDRQTIVALGAGAVSKTIRGDRIDRVFNVKNVEDYINRIDEMLHRKDEFIC
jgi:oxygen-independent coproporphyrinogen-3 oxidase